MNAGTTLNCNFGEEISKLCNELVGNFHDLSNEIMEVKLVNIKKLQDTNAQVKKTLANLQHKVIFQETATNSVEQYDQRNDIEINGIPYNIVDIQG